MEIKCSLSDLILGGNSSVPALNPSPHVFNVQNILLMQKTANEEIWIVHFKKQKCISTTRKS